VNFLGKCAWSVGCEKLLGPGGGTVGKREFQVLRDQLLDVWSLDVVGGGDFDDFEDLVKVSTVAPSRSCPPYLRNTG
jgi:hypothetical protein